MIVSEHQERLARKRGIGARHSKFGGAYVLNQSNVFAQNEEKQSKMVLHSAWRKSRGCHEDTPAEEQVSPPETREPIWPLQELPP